MKKYGGHIEFRLGASLLRGLHMAWLLGIIFSLPLLFFLIAVILMILGDSESQEIGDILASAWKSMDKDDSLGAQLWLGVILVPAALLFLQGQRASYLKLTDSGIEVYIPKWLGIGLQGLSAGRWNVDWESFRVVQLFVDKDAHPKPALQLAKYRLIIETGAEQKRLSPFLWIRPDGPDHRLTLAEAVSARRLDAAQVIERAPLVQALRARGFELSSEPLAAKKSPAGFDLARHGGLVAQLVLLFSAGLYALADTFFLGSFMALEPLPSWPFVIATVAGVIFVALAGRGAPVRERWVVGALLVGVLTAAVYPGLLRLNALTAETETIQYRAVDEGQFEPVVRRVPSLDLQKLNVPEYWSEYPAGSEHDFNLMRGAGGFYQLDLAPLYAKTRDFYSRQSVNSPLPRGSTEN